MIIVFIFHKRKEECRTLDMNKGAYPARYAPWIFISSINNVFHAHDGAVKRLLGTDALAAVGRVNDHAVPYVDGHVRAALSAVGAVADHVTLLDLAVINASSR